MDMWADLVWAGVLFVAALAVRAVLPAVLARHDEGRRGWLWAEGAIPPIMYLLVVVAVCMALTAAVSIVPDGETGKFAQFLETLPSTLDKVNRVAAVVFIGWAIIGANRRHSFFLPYNKQDADVSHRSLLRFVSALLTFVVIAFVVVIVITELGYNISGLVTGLGLGGLTFALAAKDAAANFFGGAIIVTERPFEIGDYIETAVVEGTVLDVNMRTTTVRTKSGAKTVVPNAILSGGAITNWNGGVKKRRIELDLGFEYGSDRAAVKAFVEDVRAFLATDHEIEKGEQAVHFYDLGAYSLVVKLYCFTKKPAYPEYLRIREKVVYALMELAEKHGLSFAFPTQTLELKEPKRAAETAARP